MIIQKLLISKETVKRKLPKNFNKKDIELFSREISRELSNSFYYLVKNLRVFSDGNLDTLNLKIITNHLGFRSISSLKQIKKSILLLLYLMDIVINYIKIFLGIKKVIKVKKCIILFDRNSIGYFHWINDVLPKLATIDKKKDFEKYKILLPSNFKSNFFIDSLKFFKFEIICLKENEIADVHDCIYISDISESGNPRPKILKKLRKRFTKRLNCKTKKFNKVYISRRFSRRNLTNEKEFEMYLKKKKFKIIYMENLSFKEQLCISKNAKIIIGLYGAGLVNSYWQKKKSHLIEIRPNNDLYSNCFFSASSALNINYYYILSKKKNFFRSTKTSSYYLNISLFDKYFSRLLN